MRIVFSFVCICDADCFQMVWDFGLYSTSNMIGLLCGCDVYVLFVFLDLLMTPSFYTKVCTVGGTALHVRAELCAIRHKLVPRTSNDHALHLQLHPCVCWPVSLDMTSPLVHEGLTAVSCE